MVTVDVPAGVPADVVIVAVVLQGGEQLAGENAAVAPEGKPDAPKVMVCAVPDASAAVTTAVVDAPWATDLLPSFDSAKSNGMDGVVADAVGDGAEVLPA